MQPTAPRRASLAAALLLSLLAAAPARAQEDGVYPSLPPRSVAELAPGTWTFTVHASNASPSDWLGLDEDQVFFRRLEHAQPGASWTLKIGKGGQIYSVVTPQTGEMISLQRIAAGQWVDEVLQHVVPSYLHNKSTATTPTVDGDIHQAGYYTHSDLDPAVQVIPASVYSPTFATVLSALHGEPSSFSLITWPQHAHLPRTYSENGLLMHQLTRDLGDGVIEITLVIDKWQGEETRAVNAPWASFRKQTLPAMLISRPDGSYVRDDQSFRGEGLRRLADGDTGGWVAFAGSEAPESHGIGIVYGRSLRPGEGPTSYVRWGSYGTDVDGGTVGTVKRDLVLVPGDSVFFRYFLVIGSVAKIRTYGNLLEGRVELGRIRAAGPAPGLIRVCADESRGLRRGCPEPTPVLFHAYREFTPDARPLFLLQAASGGLALVTSDPYELGDDPTDGRTRYLDFLGWAIPEPARSGSCLRHVPVATGATGASVTVSPTLADRWVRAPAPLEPDGTGCDDGDACTAGEVCLAGVCGDRAAPVVCDAPDECHEPGVCQASTGRCEYATRADGSSCTGGACVGGACVAFDGGTSPATPGDGGCGCGAGRRDAAAARGSGASLVALALLGLAARGRARGRRREPRLPGADPRRRGLASPWR